MYVETNRVNDRIDISIPRSDVLEVARLEISLDMA